MDSPELDSPASSSDSPILDDVTLPVLELNHGYGNIRGEPFPSGGKRRMPMGNIGSSTKSRRRDEPPTRRPAPSTTTWTPPEYGAIARPSRDDLIDHHVVEKIRTGMLHSEITSLTVLNSY